MDPYSDLFSPTPASIPDKIRTGYNRAFVNWQAFLNEAYRDESFYLNNQWSPEERRYLQQEQRPDYVYNLCRAAVNMVQGYQRKHRLSLVVQPVESSDQETADQLTKCMYHGMRAGKGHYAISDAFQGALVTGIGWVGMEMDYREDPESGDIRYRYYPWNSIITDPFWTQRDLSDCDYIIRRSYMSKTEAVSRFPEKKEEIMKMQGNQRDELFTYLPEQRIFQSQNLLTYTEYWEPEWEEVTVIVNPLNKKEIELTKENRKMLLPLLRFKDEIKSYKKKKPRMRFQAMLNNIVVADEYNPYNLNEYPFVPVLATYCPEYDLYEYKLQSFIRPIRDPQIEFNKRMSKLTDMIDSNLYSSWLAKKSKFDNYQDFYKTGQGRVIFAKNEADLDRDAKQIQSAPIPPGIMEFKESLNQLVMRICGVNEELLGAADDDKAGVLAKLRQGAGLVGLQDLFDGLRQSQEIIGQKSIKLYQNNYTEEKVWRITNENPTAEFYNKQFGKYDAVCTEAALTDTQQQLFFSQVMQFKEMGAPVSWSTILKAYPGQGTKEIMEDIQREEQQQAEMAQAQMQSEMQNQEVINQLLLEEAQYKLASAEEKYAKSKLDKAEMVLDAAKTARELDLAEMDSVNKFIEMVNNQYEKEVEYETQG